MLNVVLQLRSPNECFRETPTLALKFELFVCIPYVVSRKWQSLWDSELVRINLRPYSNRSSGLGTTWQPPQLTFLKHALFYVQVGSKVPTFNSRLFTVCLIWRASAGEQPWEFACAKEKPDSATAGAENVLVVSEPLCWAMNSSKSWRAFVRSIFLCWLTGPNEFGDA